VERYGAERVGQRLLVSACAEPRVPFWGRGRLAGTIAAAAAVARTGGRETRRGLVWPRRHANAAV
jgi:hypothetical protein